jgi:hypothetical protein
VKRAIYVAPRTAPRNVAAASTMTQGSDADLDDARETLVGRTFGIRKIEIHGDGLGCRVWLGRSNTR